MRSQGKGDMCDSGNFWEALLTWAPCGDATLLPASLWELEWGALLSLVES